MGCLGVHFALNHEDEQRLLLAENDEDVRRIAIEEIEERWDENWLQQTDKAWDAIHRSLNGGKLTWDSDTPLQQVHHRRPAVV
jgi:hypothetical protein